MDKRTLLIINPISGILPKDGLEARVRKMLEPRGFTVEAVTTERAGHGAELAKRAADEGWYAVIAAGGDGTVNEVASALRNSNTILGILPFGSGNGLARHLYGSIDVNHAIKVIAKDSPTDCDFGSVNDRPFFCTFGLGFDAQVSKGFSNMRRRGLISYVRSAMHELIKFSPEEYEITTAGKTFTVKAFILAVCNASQYGNNAYIAPKASVHDGLLDMIIVHAGNPLSQILVGADLFTGNLERNVKIEKLSVTDVAIRHLPGPAHIDGEPCTMPEIMNVHCHRGEIKIFTDPSKHRFKPFLTPIGSVRTDFRFLVRECVRILHDKPASLFNRLRKKKKQ